MLPHARPGGIAGLLELLNDRGGKEDLYHVADELRMEVDDLLPIVEAAALLGFAKARRGRCGNHARRQGVSPKPISRAQKVCSARPCSRTSRCCNRCSSALDSKSDHAMPLEFFRDILDEHFSDEEVKQQIETALHWGRYGEIFTYDSEDRPADPARRRRRAKQTSGDAAADGRTRPILAPAAPPWGVTPAGSSFLRDLPILLAGSALFYGMLSFAHYWNRAGRTPQAEISLAPGALAEVCAVLGGAHRHRLFA